MNWLNIYPATIPDWLRMAIGKGVTLVGNLGPAWMDFRFFTQEIYWLSLPPSLVSSKRKPSWI